MAKITALFRTHRLLAEAAVAVIALGGGVGIGFGLSDLGGSSSPVAASIPTTPTTVPTTTAQGQPKVQGVRGQITAENGSTWTVLSRAGKTVTVDITSSTQFGTKANPASASQFVTGSQIAAVGARSGTTLAATRVAVPAAATNPGGTAPPSPSTPPTAVPPNAGA